MSGRLACAGQASGSTGGARSNAFGCQRPKCVRIARTTQDKRPGRKVDNKTLFDLYPGNPSKQAGKIAGLPESLRKGGY